jgi:hypothetical protein
MHARPVFIVGCPRSGTTLLYSMLVAAGGFAVYRKETYFYDVLPRVPHLATARSRERFLRQFLSGYLGTVPGVDVEPLARAALARCRRTAEFLPRLMDAIAATQGMERWVEGTPMHVLHMHEIERAVPDALFVHVIRDGRDCALSNARQRWVPALWPRASTLGAAALYWEWLVRRGRAYGCAHSDRYIELRFEDLIGAPRAALARLGAFIDHDLDYDRMQRNPVHAMRRPNTSFRDEHARSEFTPVGRWKHQCSPEDIRLCETLVGRCLDELGYERACRTWGPSDHRRTWGPSDHRRTWGPPSGGPQVSASLARFLYLTYFDTKHTLKTHTPVGRLLTSARVWAEPPRPGERPVYQAADAGSSPVGVEALGR